MASFATLTLGCGVEDPALEDIEKIEKFKKDAREKEDVAYQEWLKQQLEKDEEIKKKVVTEPSLQIIEPLPLLTDTADTVTAEEDHTKQIDDDDFRSHAEKAKARRAKRASSLNAWINAPPTAPVLNFQEISLSTNNLEERTKKKKKKKKKRKKKKRKKKHKKENKRENKKKTKHQEKEKPKKKKKRKKKKKNKIMLKRKRKKKTLKKKKKNRTKVKMKRMTRKTMRNLYLTQKLQKNQPPLRLNPLPLKQNPFLPNHQIPRPTLPPNPPTQRMPPNPLLKQLPRLVRVDRMHRIEKKKKKKNHV